MRCFSTRAGPFEFSAALINFRSYFPSVRFAPPPFLIFFFSSFGKLVEGVFQGLRGVRLVWGDFPIRTPDSQNQIFWWMAGEVFSRIIHVSCGNLPRTVSLFYEPCAKRLLPRWMRRGPALRVMPVQVGPFCPISSRLFQGLAGHRAIEGVAVLFWSRATSGIYLWRSYCVRPPLGLPSAAFVFWGFFGESGVKPPKAELPQFG